MPAPPRQPSCRGVSARIRKSQLATLPHPAQRTRPPRRLREGFAGVVGAQTARRIEVLRPLDSAFRATSVSHARGVVGTAGIAERSSRATDLMLVWRTLPLQVDFTKTGRGEVQE